MEDISVRQIVVMTWELLGQFAPVWLLLLVLSAGVSLLRQVLHLFVDERPVSRAGQPDPLPEVDPEERRRGYFGALVYRYNARFRHRARVGKASSRRGGVSRRRVERLAWRRMVE